MQLKSRTRRTVLGMSVLAALAMAGCGGGGGGEDNGPIGGDPGGGGDPNAGLLRISGDTQAVANTRYGIDGSGTATIRLTLPASAQLQAGDTLEVTGLSANRWTLVQNAGQTILTHDLNGNVAPGTAWTPALEPRVWHWLASDATGQVLVAGEAAGGRLNTSVDGGRTWTQGNSPSGIWISIDMTPTGDRIIAVSYNGGMYMSTDFGVTWTPMSSAGSPINLANQAYESVTISTDGQGIAAAIQDGPLVFTENGGTTWSRGRSGTTVLSDFWRAIDGSADGMVLVAASQNELVYLSTDAGANWSLLPVAVGTPATAVAESWYRVKVSDDGNTIALVANTFGGQPGNGIYVSHDRGATWQRGFSLTADYTALAMSGDGQTIAATLSNTSGSTGRVLLSTDGGASFSPLVMPGTDTTWRAIAMSNDGNKLAAATGLFLGPQTGQLYTSLGGRTTIGTTGSVTGGQNDRVALQYLGDGRFSVTGSSGGPFTIR